MGRQHQGIDRPGVRQVTEGSEEQGKMEETGFEIICGAQTTLAVKGIYDDVRSLKKRTSSKICTFCPISSK